MRGNAAVFLSRGQTVAALPPTKTRSIAGQIVLHSSAPHAPSIRMSAGPSNDLRILEHRVNALEEQLEAVSAIGAVLSCLKRFEGPKQAELMDMAEAHPDPAVKALSKTLSGKR